MSEKREVWIDYIKVLACLLVVLGHYFQSMVKAGIFSETELYIWFETTIYYFHVPLFFICSGYLYQRYSIVADWNSWIRNVRKKCIVLGIPYFVFSSVTWVLKTVFSNSVNDQIGGLGNTLFLHPASPYWYLYILFFIFLITPTIATKSIYYGLFVIAFLIKILYIEQIPAIWKIFVIKGIYSNEIWFVCGMGIALIGSKTLQKRTTGIALCGLFLLLSFLSYRFDNEWLTFGMCLLACAAIFMSIAGCNERRSLSFFAKYTMPIFLMHTLFAAPVRIVLIRMGVMRPVIHMISGIFVSLLGPIWAMHILEMIKLDWIVYPGRVVKTEPIKQRRNKCVKYLR